MKKSLKKLSLKKSVVSKLSTEEQSMVKGGWTSNRNCTGFLCCSPTGGTAVTNCYDACCTDTTYTTCH